MYIKHIYICNIYIYTILYTLYCMYMYIHICLSPLYMYYYICTFNGKNWVIRIWKCSKNHLPQTAARPAATPSTGVNRLQGFEAEIFPVVMHIHLVTRRSLVLSPPRKSWAGRVESFPLVFLGGQKKTDPQVGVETAGVLVGVFKWSPWHVLRFPSQRLSQFYLCKYAGFTSWS